jgi:WD40 repeat protein
MAIYFIRFSDYQVEHIIACHEHTISSISWSIQNPRQLCSSGSDGWLYVWDIEKEKADAKIFLHANPLQAEFSPFDTDIIGVILDSGRVYSTHSTFFENPIFATFLI